MNKDVKYTESKEIIKSIKSALEDK
jgi:hypothetical protein